MQVEVLCREITFYILPDIGAVFWRNIIPTTSHEVVGTSNRGAVNSSGRRCAEETNN